MENIFKKKGEFSSLSISEISAWKALLQNSAWKAFGNQAVKE